MKTPPLFKCLLITVLLLYSCNKDDDDEQCIKTENYFELEMGGQTYEPYFLIAGSLRSYTLYLNRCSQNSNDWSLSISTDENISIFLYLINIDQSGNYQLTDGHDTHIRASCSEMISLYIYDENSSTYTYISNGLGELTIHELDADSGLFSGTFQGEVYNVQNPNLKEAITGNFKVNKATLDRFKKPCWL